MHEILADVYKKGNLAGHFSRTDHGDTAYTYAENYIESDGKPISSTLPIRTGVVRYRRSLQVFFLKVVGLPDCVIISKCLRTTSSAC